MEIHTKPGHVNRPFHLVQCGRNGLNGRNAPRIAEEGIELTSGFVVEEMKWMKMANPLVALEISRNPNPAIKKLNVLNNPCGASGVNGVDVLKHVVVDPKSGPVNADQVMESLDARVLPRV